MKNPFPPPPPPGALATLEIHEWVRDYPELMPLLRSMGVDPRKEGTESLSRASGPRAGPGVRSCLAWRVREEG